jgi:hypothetical protein
MKAKHKNQIHKLCEELSRDIKRLHRKEWLLPALSSHVIHLFRGANPDKLPKVTDWDIIHEVMKWFKERRMKR